MSNLNELKSKFDSKIFNLESDRKLGKLQPAIQKEYSADAELIDLPKEKFSFNDVSLFDAIKNRKSHRKFNGKSLTIDELAFLLWATQGIKSEKNPQFRMVPSGGARHPFETYLAIYQVDGLKPGLYRYLPIPHKLYCVSYHDDMTDKVRATIPAFNPISPGIEDSAVTFFWTALPYRVEWQYPDMSVKLVAQDSGHLCQNLYLAVEAISAGTCAIDAYFQDEADQLLGVDGREEFSVYLAIVGKI